MPLPRAPLYEVLATARCLIGREAIEYRQAAGTRVGAVLGVKEYPTPTLVGMYDRLLSAPFPFILTQSFAFLSKPAAQALLQRQYNRMVNAGDYSLSQAEELKLALDALTSSEFVMGDHHLTFQVFADVPEDGTEEALKRRFRLLNENVALARSLLADTGMVVARGGPRSGAGVLGAASRALRVAGRARRRLHRATSAPWLRSTITRGGRPTGNHWGDALALLVSSAGSPYYFSLHASDPKDPDGGSRKDTGHTLICGPTGSGKTVLIGFLLTMLARQGVAQVVFDKDHGLEILVRALGGRYLPLRNGAETGCNPLQLPASPESESFLKHWLRVLARPGSGRTLSAREEADLDQALKGTLALAPRARRLSRLIEFLDATDPEGIHARLSRWCAGTGGDFAWVFDNPRRSVGAGPGRFTDRGIRCHRLPGQRGDQGAADALSVPSRAPDAGRPPSWCAGWTSSGACLQTPPSRALRRMVRGRGGSSMGAMCLATQSVSDVLASAISRTLIEQTPTKIFFPNPGSVPQRICRRPRALGARVPAHQGATDGGIAPVPGASGAPKRRVPARPQGLRR